MSEGSQYVSQYAFINHIIVVLVVALLILLLLYVYSAHSMSKLETKIKELHNEEMTSLKKYISENNRIALETILEDLKNTGSISTEKDHHKELLNTFDRLKRLIKDDLYNNMSRTGACRTALYLLHNGQKSASGVSFIKVSCVGERALVGSGIKEQIVNHSNMPINIFDNMLEKLIENGKYIIMNDAETANTSRSQFLSSPKVHYSYAVSIYDNSNNILGFVLAEFDRAYNKHESDEEYTILKEFADKIGPILSFTEYTDLTLEDDNK